MEITAILLVTCLLGAIFAVYRIKRKLKMVSRLVFGTDSFLSGLKNRKFCMPKLQNRYLL